MKGYLYTGLGFMFMFALWGIISYGGTGTLIIQSTLLIVGTINICTAGIILEIRKTKE